MKYQAKHILRGSIEEVLEIVMDRSRDPKVYPNITSMKQTKNHETEDRIFCEYHVRGDGEIPAPLRALASPKILSWMEIGCWDKAQNVYNYRLRPFYFTHLVHAHGMIRYSPIGDDSVVRELEAEIRIDFPVLGELAAKTIVAYQLENYKLEEKLFDKYIEEHRRKKSNCLPSE